MVLLCGIMWAPSLQACWMIWMFAFLIGSALTGGWPPARQACPHWSGLTSLGTFTRFHMGSISEAAKRSQVLFFCIGLFNESNTLSSAQERNSVSWEESCRPTRSATLQPELQHTCSLTCHAQHLDVASVPKAYSFLQSQRGSLNPKEFGHVLRNLQRKKHACWVDRARPEFGAAGSVTVVMPSLCLWCTLGSLMYSTTASIWRALPGRQSGFLTCKKHLACDGLCSFFGSC